jgi:hypothetical protein
MKTITFKEPKYCSKCDKEFHHLEHEFLTLKENFYVGRKLTIRDKEDNWIDVFSQKIEIKAYIIKTKENKIRLTISNVSLVVMDKEELKFNINIDEIVSWTASSKDSIKFEEVVHPPRH